MLQAVRYSFEAIQSEARHLISTGTVRPSEPIARLQAFLPNREWLAISHELRVQDFNPNDAIVDLVGVQEWLED